MDLAGALGVLLGFAIAGALLFLGLRYLFPLLFPLTLTVTVLAATWIHCQDACRVLLSFHVAGPSGVAVPADGKGEPAYRHYLVDQVWRDVWTVLRTTVPRIYRIARTALGRVTRTLVGGPQALLVVSLWLSIAPAIVLAAVPLAVAGVVLAAGHLVIVAAGLTVWLVCVLVLRATEQVFLLARRIRQACPHEGCYAPLTLPVYACPSCRARHRRLTPNRYGAARHVCRCGTRLPTTVLLGRYRLQAYCPACERPLPPRIGRARVEPLPFVGGPDAGKTTFMVLAINVLSGAVAAAGGRTRFTVRGDELAFRRLAAELREGRVAKTGTALPTATMLDVSLPGPVIRGGDRILYLFDPSGEHYTGASRVEAMSYLAHGEAMLLVIDPFALPAVQEALTADERRDLEARGVVFSPEDPADTFQRVRNELAARADGGRQERVAVVVTKADLLRRTAVGAGVDDLPRWLEDVGLGNMARELARTAGEVRYLASGLPADVGAIAALMAWLTGLPLNGAAERAAGGGEIRAEDPRRPWRRRGGDPDLLPVGYRVGRCTLCALSVLLPIAAVALQALMYLARWGPL